MIGPYLTDLSDTSVEVRVELASDAPVALELRREGADAQAPLVVEDRDARPFRVVRAAGLEASTSYAYALRAGDRFVARGHFTTAPKPDADATLSFALYGDDRTDDAAHASVTRALARGRYDFLVNTGDLVEDGGSTSDWQRFFDVESNLLRDRCLFTAIGNHELYDDRAGANFARYFGFGGRLYGTARWGSARFFFLNAMHDWQSGEERAWLEGELSRADAEPGLVWRIAVAHHGPWSSGPHGSNAKLLDARIPELLASHKVDLLLAGHDHIYERGDAGAIKYVISGGGGAPLYRVEQKTATTRKAEAAYHYVLVTASRDRVSLEARRLDGSTLDRCGFAKGAPWDCDPPAAPPAPLAQATPPLATSMPAPAAPSVPSSRCGCSVPGAPSHGRLSPVALALALALRLRYSTRRCASRSS